jgi:hypothetical protein
MSEEDWDYGEDAPKLEPATVLELTAAVKLLYRAQTRREKLEQKVTEAKKIEQELRTKEVPEVMSRGGAGLTEFTVEEEEGITYTVVLDRNHVSAKLSDGKRDEVFKYMKENGEDHLASNNVVVPFTKGQEQNLAAFMEFLKTCPLPITPGQKQDIHPSTYTAMCKKLVANNAPIDHKVFGIHVESRAMLVEPKTKRKTKQEM